MSQEMTTFPEVLTLEEAARYLNLSPETVVQLAQEGNIPARQVDKSWRFLRSALERWLKGEDEPTVIDARTIIDQARHLSITDKMKLLGSLADSLAAIKEMPPELFNRYQ